MAIGGSFKLNNEALIFLKRWMDSVRFRSSFEKISQDIERFSLSGLLISLVGAIILLGIVNLFRRGSVR